MPIQYQEKIKKMFTESGNNFHYKAINYFRDNGWEVRVSPYYTDSFSDKPREVDMLVERSFEVNNKFGAFMGMIYVQFLIECKYMKQGTTIAFWFDDINKGQAFKLVEKKIKEVHYRENNISYQPFHYLTGDNLKVAKLYNSSKDNSSNGDVFYTALSQVLNASQSLSTGVISLNREQSNLHTLRYNLILCSNFDNMHKVYKNDTELISKIEDNFLLEVNYTRVSKEGNSSDEYFLVDVVDFNKIDDFVEKIIKEDIATVKNILKDQHARSDRKDFYGANYHSD